MVKGKSVRKSRKITPLTATIFEDQERKFVRRFGREPGPNDPVFFDPESPTPKSIDPREVLASFIEAGREAGTDPVLLYAVGKTGMIVSESNMSLFSDEELREWEEAVEEGKRILGH